MGSLNNKKLEYTFFFAFFSLITLVGLLFTGFYWYNQEELGAQIPQPNEQLTPGEVDNTLTASYLCSHSTGERRKTTDRTKEQVFAEYGITSHSLGQYEVDHRISLCAGGVDDIKNLWPQPAPSFHWKDRVEADVCRQICKGTMTVKKAQQTLLNWYPYYQKYKLGSSEVSDPDDL